MIIVLLLSFACLLITIKDVLNLQLTYLSTFRCKHRQQWQKDVVALHYVFFHDTFEPHDWYKLGIVCMD